METWTRRVVVILGISLVWLALGTGRARAQVGIPGKIWRKGSWPTEQVQRTVTIPATAMLIAIPLDISLDNGSFGTNNFILSPELEYGVSDQLTVGISQSTDVYQGFSADPVIEASSGVDFQRVALHLVFRFLGKTDLALFADLPFHLFNPFSLGIDGGLTGRIVFGRQVALLFKGGVVGSSLIASENSAGMKQDSSVGPLVALHLLVQSTPQLSLGLQATAVHGDGGGNIGTFATALYGMPAMDLFFALGFPSLNDNTDIFQFEVGVNLWR